MATATRLSSTLDLTNMVVFGLRPSYAWLLVGAVTSAWLGFFISFQAGVFALLFLILGWWAWHYPTDAFLLLIVLMPILPLLKATQTVSTFTLSKDVLIFILFTRQVLLPLARKTLPYRPQILFAPVAALVVWVLVAAARADASLLGFLRARDILLYVLLYQAVLYLPHSWDHWRTRLKWGVVVIASVLLLGGYQWFFAADSAVLRFDPAAQIWIPRISSVMAHPSIFGQFLLAAGTLGGAFFLVVTDMRGRVLAGLACLLLLPFILLTYSRAVWIGGAAAVVAMLMSWFLVSSRQRVTRRAAVLFLLTSVIGVVGISQIGTVGSLVRSAFDPRYGSNMERLEFLARLVAPLRTSEVLVGRGLGDVLDQNFREIDLTTTEVAQVDTRAVQLAKDQTLVDNQFLKTFVEMGIIGVVLYGWLYWRLGRASVRLANTSRWQERVLGIWGIGFLSAFIAQALFIDIWDIFPTNALFWIVAAAVSSVSKPGLSAGTDKL